MIDPPGANAHTNVTREPSHFDEVSSAPGQFCRLFAVCRAQQNTSLRCYAPASRVGHYLASDETATNTWRDLISFGIYLKQLIRYIVSSSVVMGFIIGAALLVSGGTTMEIDLTFDFGPFDGLWFIIGLPLLSVLVLLILSPLSFLVYRRLSKNRKDDSAPEA